MAGEVTGAGGVVPRKRWSVARKIAFFGVWGAAALAFAFGGSEGRGFAYMFLGIQVYLLPAMIAGWRRLPTAGKIGGLNLLWGWTLIGWVLALGAALS